MQLSLTMVLKQEQTALTLKPASSGFQFTHILDLSSSSHASSVFVFLDGVRRRVMRKPVFSTRHPPFSMFRFTARIDQDMLETIAATRPHQSPSAHEEPTTKTEPREPAMFDVCAAT